MFLVIGRTFKEGLSNFWRNGWLSIASVSVLLLSLLILGVLFMIGATANNVLESTKEKVNVSIYFLIDTPEENILKAKKDLEGFSEIKSVDYVSRDQALVDFRKNNATEPVIIQSLDEIGENPLQASLVVKANDPTQYDKIMEYVNNAPFKEDISRVNYGKNKDVIERLNKMVAEIRKVGLSLTIFFSVVSVLIIFNTIRLTIYTHKQEIEVMRLVGASNTYIRLPFIFEGIIYGLIASTVSILLLFAAVKLVSPYAENILHNQDLVGIFLSNALILWLAQLALGIMLGIISSTIAMRKYLKI